MSMPYIADSSVLTAKMAVGTMEATAVIEAGQSIQNDLLHTLKTVGKHMLKILGNVGKRFVNALDKIHKADLEKSYVSSGWVM